MNLKNMPKSAVLLLNLPASAFKARYWVIIGVGAALAIGVG